MPTSSTTLEYKKIAIPLARPLSDGESKAISRLQDAFPRTDFFFETTARQLVMYLKELDVRQFVAALRTSARELGLNGTDNITIEIQKRVEAIRSYGLKGKKRLYVGYNRERKVKNREDKERERGAYYYALNHSFSRKNNEIPACYVNKIICGDSQDVLGDLPDNCVDLIFTSPPYNFGLDYENHKDGVRWETYFDKLFAIFDECVRVLKFGGRIAVDVQPLFSDYIPIHHIISNWFIQRKLIWKGEILWDKHNYNCKYTAWGSWKSPSNPYLKYTWESIEIFCKGSLKHDGHRSRADISPDEFKRWVYAKWDIAPERDMARWGHPAMFPEELVRRILKLFSFENDVVLDPFNGVGTTTAVAKYLKRRYLGIDVSEEYCHKARERLDRVRHRETLF